MSFTFKALSGPLNGVEFSLSREAYCICVGAEGEGDAKLAASLALTERTLFVLASAPQINFTLHLDEDLAEDAFSVTVYYSAQHEKIRLKHNEIQAVGGLQFAIKRSDEPWCDEVLQGRGPQLLVAAAQPSKLACSPTTGRTAWVRRLGGFGWGLVVLLILLLLGGGALAWNAKLSSPKVENIYNILHGSSNAYTVSFGRDQIYTVFAQTERDALWARQALMRSSLHTAWRVTTASDERRRLSPLLEREGIVFFTLRFQAPLQPTILLSSTRMSNDSSTQTRVRSLLMQVMPYAEQVSMEWHSDLVVAEAAQDSLKRIGLEYHLQQGEKEVGLFSSVYAGDVRLAEFKRVTEAFYATWGDRYIHFNAELRDDWLKDKSFKYGQEGYVRMSPSHWLIGEPVGYSS
ncbi:PrgH/EprH family type III secretion apparatus protein [Iodobacter fluviatilis]|uniref:Type III secretion system PrgH/EprH family protein n=1 Tax=Iodobacter fluviatilis TaxID=537 RepID=A0A377Q5H9_9NEIS|nr:PrgH/EprH family type III secretion apparatus protein [Iodobacter fluviatilis]TCU80278.1 type III secretion system PrgH/EprH family protein [Iodobacter fluviatilis]STQ90183.1 type III secretion system needle complex protein PrgH [Iodobacter fluviatilis]